MFDAKDDVETQWKKWQEANPESSFLPVDENTLREQTIKDLTYVSAMDVREYTLYQKWCEIKDKYPTFVNNTLFGEEVQLENPAQQVIVDEVKKAIRESPLSDEQKAELVTWCDVSLPYVVEAVKLVKAEVGKVAGVALAEVRKCCPSFFTKKV